MQLSRNFRLEEWPCWERASSAQIADLRHLVTTVLQPLRDAVGPIQPTSWRWWRAGCTPRTGHHAQGAVDVVPLRVSTREAALWLLDHRAARFGVVLDEGDHLHITPPGVGGQPGGGRVYTQGSDGGWIDLELIYGPRRGTGTGRAGWGALVLFGLLALAATGRR